MSAFQGNREVSTFPIATLILQKLTSAGLFSVDDLQRLKPSDLSREAKITPAEALEVLQTIFEDAHSNVKKVPAPQAKTAWDLLQDEHNSPTIVTFCETLDDMMGGGVPLCKITEFSGAPGIGKTQMCLQLAVDVQIPACLGGVGGEVVYIDTEGSFIVERLVDIATATLEHCQIILNQGESSNPDPEMANFNLDKVLSSTHYYRVHDYVELLAVVHLLPKFFQEHPKIKLLIVDSIACPFRQGFDDMSVRTRVLSTLSQTFIRLATQFKCAVVLTNQMTTKITPTSSHLVPALGESWGHASTTRIILHWEGNQRKALLYKSPSRPEATCVYQVTMGGIRDAVTEEEAEDKKEAWKGESDQSSASVTGTISDHRERLHKPEENIQDQPKKRMRIS